MGLSLVKGYGADAGKIQLGPNFVVDYSDRIVVMETPAPYADKDIVTGSAYASNGYMTSGSGWAQVNGLGPGSEQGFYSECYFFMFHNGGTRTITLTAHPNASFNNSWYALEVNAQAYAAVPLPGGATSVTAPYLRYRIFVVMATAPQDRDGDLNIWMRVDIT